MKAGAYWTPRAESKIGLPLGPRMRVDGTTQNIDTSYQMTLRRAETVTIEAAWAAFTGAVDTRWWEFAEEDPYGGVTIHSQRVVDLRGHALGGVSISSLEFCYTLSRIAEHLNGEVLEIGGGYGGFARALYKLRPEIPITIVDLEPMQRIQKHYLGNTAFGLKVSFAREIPYRKFGLAVNTRSFCEMDLLEVNEYFRGLDRVLRPGGIFYSVNHDACRNNFKDWKIPPRWMLIDERISPMPWKKHPRWAWHERTWQTPTAVGLQT